MSPIFSNAPHFYPKRVTVWCALWSEGINESFSFANEVGIGITVNDERYRAMMTQFIVPYLGDIGLDAMWDNVTCRTDCEMLAILYEVFYGLVTRIYPNALAI